jgi:hypothetical protein
MNAFINYDCVFISQLWCNISVVRRYVYNMRCLWRRSDASVEQVRLTIFLLYPPPNTTTSYYYYYLNNKDIIIIIYIMIYLDTSSWRVVHLAIM